MDYEYILKYKMNNHNFKFFWKATKILNVIACIGIVVNLICISFEFLMINIYYNSILSISIVFTFLVVVIYIVIAFDFCIHNTNSSLDYSFIWYKGLKPLDIHKMLYKYYATSYTVSTILIISTVVYSYILGEIVSFYIILMCLFVILDVFTGRYISACKKTIMRRDFLKTTIRNTQFYKGCKILSRKAKSSFMSLKRLCISSIFLFIEIIPLICLYIYFFVNESDFIIVILILIGFIDILYNYIDFKYIIKYDCKKIDILI